MTAEFLTIEEACHELNIGRAYLYRLLRRYDIPRYRRPVNGRKVLLKRADLERLREPQRSAFQNERPGIR